MTHTLTTERQQFEQWWHEEYCHLEGSGEAAFVKHVAWEAMQKARELLANREAQPVFCVDMDSNFIKHIQKCSEEVAKWPEWKQRGSDVTQFAAPPAPAVVKLPTEFYSDEGIVVRLEQVMAALAVVGVKYERKGGACRAAMLTQPVSQGGNSPVIPDGWKLVPVDLTSEMQAAWDSAPNSSEDDTVNIMNAYRAMLAAAPGGRQ